MLAPLNRTAAERDAVIARFERAFSRSDEEEAEMERLADLARHTLVEDWDRLAAIYKLVPDGWNTPLTPAELQPLDLSKSPAEVQREAQQYEETLAMGYAYTDHFCQGSSFPLGEPWLIHLTPPPGAAND